MGVQRRRVTGARNAPQPCYSNTMCGIAGFIGKGDVRRVSVGVVIDRNGPQAHRAGRANDATCDFTAIGNKNTVEH